MVFVVYIIQSQVDGSYYIGYTRDIDRRLDDHNRGMSLYTSRKAPWVLVYTETCPTKQAALKRERFLKAQRNRTFYQELIQGKK